MAEEQGDQTERDQPTGRHAAADEGGSDTTAATETPSEPPTEHVATPDAEPTRQVPASEAGTTEHVATPASSPDAAPTEHVATPTSTPDAAPTEHVGGPAAEPTRQMERPQGPPPAAPARGGGGVGARRAVRRVTGLLATLLRIAGALLAVVLVAFIVLTLVGVNPDNAAAQLVAEGADVLVMRFRDLFLPADPRLALVVDYGLAALFWLVVGLIAARVVRALGRLV